MSRLSFEELSSIVFGGNLHDQRRKGRKPSIGKKGKLEILIFYLNSRCKLKELSLIFGLVPIVVSRTIDEMYSRYSSSIIEQIKKVLNQIRKVFDHEFRRFINMYFKSFNFQNMKSMKIKYQGVTSFYH